MRKAVIDVGSNSVLLLVAEKTPENNWQTVYESSAVTGLGQGTKTTGLISEPGFTETLAAIKNAFQEATSHGATSTLAGGTMALRIARNASDFLAAAHQQQTPVHIVSGNLEAQLGFLAVAEDPLFASESIITIIDPGGHSTELATALRTKAGWKTLFRKSFPVGALGLRETVLTSPNPDFSQRLKAIDTIDGLIGLEYLPHQCGRVVTLGATGTNLVSIKEKLLTWQPEKVHGHILDFEEIGRATGWLCDMTDEERAKIPGLEPKREQTIHIGVLILERFLQITHALQCTVSVRGWRHALLDHDHLLLNPDQTV